MRLRDRQMITLRYLAEIVNKKYDSNDEILRAGIEPATSR